MSYRVHVGYTARGRDKWRRFSTEESARSFAEKLFQATGVIVAVEVAS